MDKSLQNNKISDLLKFEVFADDKLNVTDKLKLVLGRVENIVGKGENAGYPAFSPFNTMFSNGFFFKVGKSPDSS